MHLEEGSKRKTKDAFLIEALRLFAQKGYEAVSVSQIAQAVQVSAPALYKHYGSKMELFEAIIEMSNKGYEEQMKKLQVDYNKDPIARKNFLSMSIEEQIASLQNLFLATLHDEFPSLLRKLMKVEQFHFPELAAIYNERYVLHQYASFETLFQYFIEEGKLKDEDAYMLAVQYISPVSLLIEVCDREPDKEEWALEMIDKHIRMFFAAHSA